MHLIEFDEDSFKWHFQIDDEEGDLQKIRFEIGSSQKERLVAQKILTWGNNNLCQLGFGSNDGGKMTAHPKSVSLPEDVSKCKDAIVDISCNRKISFILT